MLIGDRGEQHGVMPIKQALEFARDIGTDLVEVSPNTDPPVCRLLDYGKLRYMSAKKERESRKSQKGTELKEMRFRPNIGEHDLQSKLRKVKEMIDAGNEAKDENDGTEDDDEFDVDVSDLDALLKQAVDTFSNKKESFTNKNFCTY